MVAQPTHSAPGQPERTKVFIVHDDVLVRFALTQLLSAEDTVTVVGSAPFDDKLVKAVKLSGATVVVLDAILNHELPLSRFGVLKELRLPIIALTDADETVARHIIPLLEAGAVGFVQKPQGDDNLTAIRDQLLHELHTHVGRPGMVFQGKRRSPLKVVAIGSSTGGPEALTEILPKLPKNFDAGVVVVQHMPGGFTKRFVDRLNKHCNLEVKEVENGDRVEKGKILVGKGDFHLVFDPKYEDGVVYAEARLTLDPPQWKLRPTVDNMMTSLAPIYGRSMVGVILTGMGQDGVIGMREIKTHGGRTCVQDEASSVVYGMAQEVVKHNLADRVVPLSQIIPEVTSMVEGL